MQTLNRSLYQALVSKGIFPLILTGVVLIFVGLFLVTQSIVGQLLPHDIRNLGMTTAQLSVFNGGKIVKFMFHDRVAFGGSLIAVGLLYIWLVEFHLKKGRAWAWWLFVLSGITGFGSFLTYIGYGYFDTWHAVGTVLLIPVFLAGVVYSYKELQGNKKISALLARQCPVNFSTASGIGNFFLLFISMGLALGGCVIMTVGMTSVFVPQDLGYMQIKVCGLTEINSRLIPIIAHDRASFGGGLTTIGLMLFFSTWCARPARNLWEILALSVSIGFISAIGVHFWIGYLDFWHIAPAYLGLVLFYAGLVLTYNPMMKQQLSEE